MWFDLDEYRQHLLLGTERFTEDVTDAFKLFVYSLSTNVRKLVEKQRKEVETTVRKELEAIDDLPRDIDIHLVSLGRLHHIFVYKCCFL